jgi:hypothetical protein
MIEYLARHFAPARAPVQTDGATLAPETYTRACLVCHDEDLVAAQRITRAGWTREVEKMIRWGAAVSDTDKNGLIDYLSARFPTR